ncbi:MAG: hypothetical protein ACXWZP_05345, partial [Gaiellaceae bacterium]
VGGSDGEPADATDVEEAADGAAPKKRTRRGTRGGRGRHKPAGGATNGDDAEAVAEPGPAESEEKPAVEAVSEAPDGYVPMSEWLDDFDRR